MVRNRYCPLAKKKQQEFRAICAKLNNNDATANVLNLSAYGKIDWEGSQVLRDALQGNTWVTKLDLLIGGGATNCSLCSDGLLLLIPFIATSPTLRKVCFSTEGEADTIDQATTSAILATLSCSKPLAAISLFNIRYDRPEVLETLLSKTRTLKEFDFFDIGNSGNFLKVCQSLQHGFQQNQTVETIKFLSRLGPHVEDALFGMFKLPKLKSLTLSVVLTDKVSQVLRCFFNCNETLRSLNLTLEASQLAPVLGGLAHNRGIQDVEIVASAEVQKCVAAARTELFQKNTTTKSFRLRWGGRSVDCECATALANGLCDNVSLQKLDLFGTFDEGAFDGAAWQTMIQTNRSWTELDLGGCNIGYDVEGQASFKLFTHGLSRNTSLKKLDLAVNYIGNAGGGALADGLAISETLVSLDMCHCNIVGEDGQAVFRKLWCNKGLQHLDWGDNKFGGLGREWGLPKNHTLKHVNLRECSLDSDDCRAIYESLRGNKVLQELILYGNQAALDGSYATALTELLASTPLRKLDLQCCTITSDGMTQLTGCLRGNTSSRHLDLTYCELGNDGLLQLAEALVENTTLSDLLLDANDFDQDSCCGFMQLLPLMKGLKELRFDSSLFNEVVGLELVEGLKGSKSLEKIHGIDETDLPSDMKKSIEFYLKMNRNGRRFLQESKDDKAVPLPFGAWPCILAKMTAPSERDELFHFLRHKGDLVHCPPPSRKRKAGGSLVPSD